MTKITTFYTFIPKMEQINNKNYNTNSLQNLVQNGRNYTGFLNDNARRNIADMLNNWLYACGYKKEKAANNALLSIAAPNQPTTPTQGSYGSSAVVGCNEKKEKILYFLTFNCPKLEDLEAKVCFRKVLKKVYNDPKNVPISPHYIWVSEKNPNYHFHLITDNRGLELENLWLLETGGSFFRKSVKDFGIADYLTKLVHGVDMRTGEKHERMLGRVWGCSRASQRALCPLKYFPNGFDKKDTELFRNELFYNGYENREKLQEEIGKIYRKRLGY